jgi:CBS domain-containing protein
MKKDVECVSPKDTVQTAAVRMRDENIGFLPVCDQSRKVLGTITDRDLAIRVLASGAQPNTSVQDAMTQEVVCCRPDDDLRKAEQLMSQSRKSRIMCVDADDRLVGVISLSDIAEVEDARGAAQTLRAVASRETQQPHAS